MTASQRSRKCAATSATTGPRRTQSASCQPTSPRASCAGESKRSPAYVVRSMPPTNAMRSSMTTIFSWWQCSGRSLESVASSIFVPKVSASRTPATSWRSGWKSGNGEPAQRSMRTGMRSASSASRLRSSIRSPSRASAKSGEMYQPARWTCERARLSSTASRGRASAPSTSTSSEHPARGGGSPAVQSSPSAGSSARPQPSLRSRRR